MRYSRLPVRLCYFNNSVASDRLLCAFVPFFLHSYPMGVIIGLISYHEGLKEITHRKDLTQYPVHYWIVRSDCCYWPSPLVITTLVSLLISSHLITNPQGWDFGLHLTDKKTSAQKGEASCPRSHSSLDAKTGWEPCQDETTTTTETCTSIAQIGESSCSSHQGEASRLLRVQQIDKEIASGATNNSYGIS